MLMRRGPQTATDEGNQILEETLELRALGRHSGGRPQMTFERIRQRLLCQIRRKAPASREGALIQVEQRALQQRPEHREALLDGTRKVGRAVEGQAYQEAQLGDTGGEILEHAGGEWHDQRRDNALQ